MPFPNASVGGLVALEGASAQGSADSRWQGHFDEGGYMFGHLVKSPVYCVAFRRLIVGHFERVGRLHQWNGNSCYRVLVKPPHGIPKALRS